MNRDAADKRYHWRHLQCGSGIAGVFITPSHSLPVAEREFVRPVHLSGDAGFAVLEVAGRMPVAFDRSAAKGPSGRVAV